MKRSALVALVFACAVVCGAVSIAQQGPTPSDINGEIDRLVIDSPGDPSSAATIVVGGKRVSISADTRVELPAVTLTVRELFDQAPAGCRKSGESGLAKADGCRANPSGTDAVPAPAASDAAPADGGFPSASDRAPVAKATISAVTAEDGRLSAVAVRITKNVEALFAGVTFVNEAGGYLRLNGPLRVDEGGIVLRINDPLKQLSDQGGGPGCGNEGNCSPDARFRLDSATPSVRFDRGNPACIGGEAQACPASNRDVPAEDLATHMPIQVGDNLKAEGAYEIAGGVRFFSAQSLVVQGKLSVDR